MSNIEGRLQIDLYSKGQTVQRVVIQSNRPLQASRIFAGKTAHEVLEILPLLYTVCGSAQARAATLAFEQALGIVPAEAISVLRAVLVQLETAREHLWRILIDWPVFLEAPQQRSETAAFAGLFSRSGKALSGCAGVFSLESGIVVDRQVLHNCVADLNAMLTAEVFSCTPKQWLRICHNGMLEQWAGAENTVAAQLLHRVYKEGWQRLGACETRFLPLLPQAWLHRQLGGGGETEFIARPMRDGKVCETTPLARLSEHAVIRPLLEANGTGLLPRLAARLVELAQIPVIMQSGLESIQPGSVFTPGFGTGTGVGVGQVEAARGRLIHRVELNDERVSCYQILAPTEWNFHPAGVVAGGLGNLCYEDEITLRTQSALLIDSVDPCVGYDLKVH